MAASKAYKSYIAPREAGLPPRIDCMEPEVRDAIRVQLESGQDISANLFDDAQKLVVNHMARTSYIQFRESEYQANHDQVRYIDLLIDRSPRSLKNKNSKFCQL